jgi:hypothetical protein
MDQVTDPDLIEIGWSLTIPGVTGDATEDRAAEVVAGERVPADPAAAGAEVPQARVAVSEVLPRAGRTVFSSPTGRSDTRGAFGSGAIGSRGVYSGMVREYAVPHGLVYGAEWIEPTGAVRPQEGILTAILGEGRVGSGSDVVRKGTLVSISPAPGVVLRVGDLLQVFRRQWSDRRVGTSYKPSGVLVVTEVVGEGVSARVSSQFERIHVGDLVRRAPEYDPTPSVFPTPARSQVTAVILGFPEERPFYGVGSRVFLDLGAETEVSIGDVFRADVTASDQDLGSEKARLQIVRVYGLRATARIIKISNPNLTVGDILRLVEEMD